jgi:hypothetical protein
MEWDGQWKLIGEFKIGCFSNEGEVELSVLICRAGM